MRTAYKNPAIHRAFGILETLRADETVRHLARVREDVLRNERQFPITFSTQGGILMSPSENSSKKKLS